MEEKGTNTGRRPDMKIRIEIETVEDGKDKVRLARLTGATRFWLAAYLMSALLSYIGFRCGLATLAACSFAAYCVSFFFYIRKAFFKPDVWADGYDDGHAFEYRRRSNATWWLLALVVSLPLTFLLHAAGADAAAGLAFASATVSSVTLVASLFVGR